MENDFSSRFVKLQLGNLGVTVSLNASLSRPTVETETMRRDAHFHAQYELFFAEDTPLVLEVEGQPLSLCRAALCVPPFTPHVVHHRENAFCFCFELRQLGGAEGDGSVFSAMSGLFSAPVRPLRLEATAYGHLRALARAYEKPSFLGTEEAAALLKLIFLNLYEHNVAVTPAEDGAAIHDYCVVIDQMISNRYTESITLSTVAEALHLSTKQTSRIIRKRYRATLGTLLKEKRLQVAASLLQNTDRPVSEIAARLFQRSDNYFYRLFRERYGVSPLTYRKQHREDPNVQKEKP